MHKALWKLFQCWALPLKSKPASAAFQSLRPSAPSGGPRILQNEKKKKRKKKKKAQPKGALTPADYQMIVAVFDRTIISTCVAVQQADSMIVLLAETFFRRQIRSV